MKRIVCVFVCGMGQAQHVHVIIIAIQTDQPRHGIIISIIIIILDDSFRVVAFC